MKALWSMLVPTNAAMARNQGLTARVHVRFGEGKMALQITMLLFVKDGMCRIDANGVAAIGLGQIFVRNLAMCFCAYLGPR